MKMHKLLRALLAPFMLYVDGEGGGGEPAGGGDSSVDWAAMNDGVDPGADDDDLGDDGEVAPAPSPAPAPAAGPAPAPAAKPATTPPNNAGNPETPTNDGDPADPDSTDPAKKPELSPENPDEPQLTPEQQAARDKKIAEDFAEWEQAQIARLSKEYEFSEEEATRLQTEPELVLPQMAAKLHMQVMKNAVEAVQRLIPQLVQPVLKSQKTEAEAMEFFYGRNPDLKGHHKQVMIAGKMFRQMNPKATADEAAEKIGAIVRSTLGLKPVEAGAPAPSPAPAPAATKPHKPAGAGGGSGTKPTPAKQQDGENPWEDLID